MEILHAHSISQLNAISLPRVIKFALSVTDTAAHAPCGFIDQDSRMTTGLRTTVLSYQEIEPGFPSIICVQMDPSQLMRPDAPKRHLDGPPEFFDGSLFAVRPASPCPVKRIRFSGLKLVELDHNVISYISSFLSHLDLQRCMCVCTRFRQEFAIAVCGLSSKW